MKNKNKSAFTLAEVLITLTIIGIIAALTIPILWAKYQRVELETAFKRAYSQLQNSMAIVRQEDIDTSDYYAGNENTQFAQAVLKNYKVVKSNVNLYNYIVNIKTYNKTQGSYDGCIASPSHLLNDGSSIGISYNCFARWIVVDTNGPYKAPNAYGHDLFVFGVDNDNMIVAPGTPYHWQFAGDETFCSKNSTSDRNGAACSKFAMNNICPDDNSKTYWECLK